MLAELEEATTRIANLVGAVRSYSYLDQAPRQTVDIHEGLESTLSLLGHKLRGKQIEIVRDFDPGLPGVEASGSELNQVWTNLIDNAVDAVDGGGRITLRTRRQGERVCVEIGDNGPGIPADLQARIFDAFFTTKPVDQGTGLGLDIAQRIVVRHHGELRLSPSPGTRASRCCCPYAERAPAELPAAGGAPAAVGARPRPCTRAGPHAILDPLAGGDDAEGRRRPARRRGRGLGLGLGGLFGDGNAVAPAIRHVALSDDCRYGWLVAQMKPSSTPRNSDGTSLGPSAAISRTA